MSPAKSLRNPAPRFGALFFVDPGVEGAHPDELSHFSPRIGFAWDMFGNGKTSLRGGFGVFYGSISGNEWNTMTNFQPFSTRLTFTNINQKTNAAGVPLGASLVNPYNAFVGGNPCPYKGTCGTGGGLFPVASDFKWPRTYQMNVSVQRHLLETSPSGGLCWTESRTCRLAVRQLPVLTALPRLPERTYFHGGPTPVWLRIAPSSDQSANYHDCS